MDEILVVGRADEEISEIRSVLAKHFSEYQVRYAKPYRDSISQHFSSNTRLAVFNYQTLPEGFAHSAHSMRKLGFDEAILMLAHAASHSQLLEVRRHKGLTLLQKPFAKQDLTQLSQKILCNEDVCQRLHPRFAVQETVAFESFGVSGMTAAQMSKMSLGGAFLQMIGHQELHLGDIIQVHVQLRNLDKYHRVPAQVVHCEHGRKTLCGENFGVRWLGQFLHKQVA